jgi:hypothetical protein
VQATIQRRRTQLNCNTLFATATKRRRVNLRRQTKCVKRFAISFQKARHSHGNRYLNHATGTITGLELTCTFQHGFYRSQRPVFVTAPILLLPEIKVLTKLWHSRRHLSVESMYNTSCRQLSLLEISRFAVTLPVRGAPLSLRARAHILMSESNLVDLSTVPSSLRVNGWGFADTAFVVNSQG